MDETCAFEGCDRPRYYRKPLCHTHYCQQRYGKTGELRPIVDYGALPRFCTSEGCSGKAVARGLCGKHYSRLQRRTAQRKKAVPVQTPPASDKCGMELCREQAQAEGFCESHLRLLKSKSRI